MIDDGLRQSAIALYDRFTHEHGDRRAFMRELALLAGGAAAAEGLLASIAADSAAAAVVRVDDSRIVAQPTGLGVDGALFKGYFAHPRRGRVRGTVLVIHENRGLTDHIRDVTRRCAAAGFYAVAPDFLSRVGGTPLDEDRARDAIGKLDLVQTVADAVSLTDFIAKRAGGNGRIGAVGFCWGGAMVNRIAVAAGDRLTAGVAFYGPAPDAREAAKVRAAMLLHYAGLDDRVNATGRPWTEALKAAGATVESHVYPGVNHAFNNDTAVGRYDQAAADLAWTRTIAFLAKYLTGSRR